MNFFANPSSFYFLIPFIIFILYLPFYLYSLKKRKKSFNEELLKKYSSLLKTKFLIFKIAFLNISILLMIISFARPQWGELKIKGLMRNLDLVILFDVSNSMNCEDIKPSRLEKAKLELKNLIEKIDGIRVGLVAFSSQPVILSPLTDDKGAIYIFLEILDSSLILTQGTDLGKGIEEALRLFSYDEEERERILLIFSDGEDMGESSFSAAHIAETLSVKIFSIGTGTNKGAAVKDYSGKEIIDPETGKTAISRLVEDKLIYISERTNGQYFRISSESENLNKLIETLNKIKKKEYTHKEKEKREDQYQFFLFFSYIFLLFSILIPFRGLFK